MFNLDEDLVFSGNGAAELINTLGRLLKGKLHFLFPLLMNIYAVFVTVIRCS